MDTVLSEDAAREGRERGRARVGKRPVNGVGTQQHQVHPLPHGQHWPRSLLPANLQFAVALQLSLRLELCLRSGISG